jgi:hypothetical protein
MRGLRFHAREYSSLACPATDIGIGKASTSGRQATGKPCVSGAARPARFAESAQRDRQFPACSPSFTGNIPRDSDLARYSL